MSSSLRGRPSASPLPRLLLAAAALLLTFLATGRSGGGALAHGSQAAAPPVVEKVEFQPLAAQVKRVVETLNYLGAPLPAADRAALEKATTVQEIQRVLDRHCLLLVNINPEQRVKVAPGPAAPALDENGWRSFLVKVANEAGTTAELKVESPNAAPIYRQSTGSPRPKETVRKEDVPGRWLDLAMFNQQPLSRQLSGLEVEYRILQLYCGDRNLGVQDGRQQRADGGHSPSAVRRLPSTVRPEPFRREAKISFNVGQGTQDLGFRNDCDLLFTCSPSVDVKLRILDADGTPAMASLVIRDGRGRVYPAQARRLAPDFFFHPQVYRQDGEVLKLPPGEYTVQSGRGPEYLARTEKLTIAPGRPQTLTLRLQRWIDPAKFGWISGDHHIHAAGCAHYENPTQGVFPEDMWRHILGEDLKVGCSLTWGPCYYYQKQFFTGKPDKLSTDKYVLRYDIEVSGWSSHRAGHLCILRLTDQDYPGTKVQEDWPNLGLSVLKWAKAQGAVTGPAHSGWGLAVPGTELPNYNLPPYDGIGANEYIMQVTHEVPGPGGKLVPAVDFMSTVDTPYVWELNMWYHTLNAGFRTRISGETDFPCIYGERVGLGRVYVKLDDPKKIDFDRWVDGIAAGRSYVSDGKSHLMDFQVNGVEVGTRNSEVRLAAPGTVRAMARVAALLDEQPHPEIKNRPYTDKPYWDVERARIGETRDVPVELLVNGVPVATQRIPADGEMRQVSFANVKIERSSWVALRILPSSHSNPVFVMVGDKPVRASRRSIDWCLKGVDVCWNQKARTYKPEEMETARAAYEHARQVYRQRLAEADGD
jgi:hypothetical protein